MGKPSPPNLTQTSGAPILIVGAGALGLAVAHALVYAGFDCCVVAPRVTNGVASQAAGAMIDAFGEMDHIANSLDRQRLDIKVKAQRFYGSWLETLEAQSGLPIFRQTGLFLIGNSQGGDDRLQLQRIRQEMEAYGEPYHQVNPKDVPGLEPQPAYPVYESLFLEQAMTVDSAHLLAALEQANQNSNHYQRLDDRVVTIDSPTESGQPTWQVTTAHGVVLQAETLILCAGAHSFDVLGSTLHQKAHLPPLYFGRGSGCVVRPDRSFPYGLRTPNRPLASGYHLVPRADGRVYFGANNFFGTDLHLNTSQGSTIADLHSLFDGVIKQLNRHLAQATLERSTWGLRPVTPHDYPLIGTTSLPGLLVATGTHRTGIHYAPLFAQWILHAVQGKPPTPEALAFSPQALADLPTPTPTLQDGVQALVGSLLSSSGQLPYDHGQKLENLLMHLLSQNPEVQPSLLMETTGLREIPNLKSALQQLLHESQNTQP